MITLFDKIIKSKILSNKPTKVTLVVLVALLIASQIFGHNPKSIHIPAEWEKSEEFKKEVQRLSDKDKEVLLQALLRDGLSKAFGRDGVVKSGMTIGEVIDAQTNLAKNQTVEANKEEALRKEVDSKREVMQIAIKKDLVVSLVAKKNRTAGYREFIELQVAYKNSSEKNISGIKGKMIFKDIFGDVILSLNDSMDHSIKAGETYVSKGSGLDYNQFMDEHKKLYATDFEKIKFEYAPEVVIFTDGTKIEVPQID